MAARRFLVGALGTATGPGGSPSGLYLCTQDPTGRIDVLDVCLLDNPSFVVVHPRLPVAYAVNEIAGRNGGVSVVEIEGDRLRARQRTDSLGQLPCHLALLEDARALAVVHYGCGTVVLFQLDHGGALTGAHRSVRHAGASVDRRRQASAHPHCVVICGDSAYVTDLGQDCVVQYRADSLAERSRCAIHAGAGPRHLVLDASRNVGWVGNELDNTVSRLAIEADGSLREVDCFGVLPEVIGRSAISEIALHPNGRWLYVGNRGHDSIWWCGVLPDGALGRGGPLGRGGAVATQGAHPRHFALTPGGGALLVANRDSDSLVSFAVDPDSGELIPLAEPFCDVPRPVCVRWL
jgi:6-phosphogluconolactonase